MFREEPVRFHIGALLVVAFSAWCALGAGEQAEPTPSATQPAEPNQAVASAPSAITVDTLQAQKKQIAESTNLADDVKTKLTEAYDKAIAQLKLAQELAERRQQYDQTVKGADAELARTKELLAQPPAPLPEAPPDLTLAQAEQALNEAKLALEEARKRSTTLENEPKQRADRRTKIPEEINAAKQRLEEISQRLATLSAQASPGDLDQANRTLLQLEQNVLQSRIEANTQELASYDATNELLAAQRDLAKRRLGTADKRVAFWQEKVDALRARAAEAAQNEALRAKQETRDVHPVLKPIVDENAKLAQEYADLIAKIQEVTKHAETVETRLASVSENLTEARNQIEAVGRVTSTMGAFLLGKRDQLPSISENQRRIRNRTAKISTALVNHSEYDEQWSDVGDLTDELQAIDQQLDATVTDAQREAIKKEAEGYYESRRKTLRALADRNGEYAETLANLDIKERALVETVQEFADFIDANILWVRGSHPLALSDVGRTAQATGWLLSPTNWRQTGAALWTDLKADPLAYLLIAFVTVASVAFHARIHRRIELVSERVRQIQTDRFFLTLEALLLTTLLAATWPVLLLLARWRLLAIATDGFPQAVAAGLWTLAAITLIFGFLRHLAMPHGLAHDHFRMREEPLAFLRRHLRWFFALSAPLVFIFSVMHAQQADETWYGTVGRLVFVIAVASLAAFLLIVLRPTAPLMESYLRQRRGGWFERLRYFWYSACLLVPLALAVLAAMGYLYGARHLNEKVLNTIGLVLLALLIRALFVRGLTVAQRRLALLERQKRQAAAGQKAQQAEAVVTAIKVGEPAAVKAKPEQTIFEMSQQTRRLIGAVTTIFLAVGFWYTWNDVLPAIEKLGTISLYGAPDQEITLGAIVTALVVVVLTVIVARNVPGLLEIVILRRLPLDRGVRFAIITICRYILVIIGVVWAFTEIGVGWGKVQWLIAAMTVGLGFGLQEIFANFVSGLIMLFEQPIRVDDVVTVGDVTGRVTMIRIRATTIRKWDQRELIVPNKEFITGRLINWTLSDDTLRRDFAVGIAYGSDIRKAERLLYEIAQADPRVLKDPAPTVLFKGFGNSSLDFELRVYFSGLANNLPLWHDINVAIDDAFRQGGIEIAFPQQDVHIRTIDRDIPIRLAKPESQTRGPDR
ncbi:MAG: mechanosensitive ion channel [Sedimentisphaerales bacterium]|nr:mechanosensitive ion channel [Sedimentisphaerales bacterium]